MTADYYNEKSSAKGNGLVKLFNSLTPVQKISIGLVIIVLVVSIFALVQWSNRPEYSILYSGLPAEDTSSIAQKLEDASIQYKVSDDGGTISVDSSKLAQARLSLAGEGIPYNSVVGFELFDQQFFGLTDFTQQVNYQRALEGELSRTISEIAEVESTRVHLVLSEQELFSDTSTPASASIILKLAGGEVIDAGNIKAIGNLVTNAVKGLKPENIAIIDTQGNLLTTGIEDGSGHAGQQNVTDGVESEIENSITTMLIRLFGADNVLVNVKADINFDKKASETETYMPEEDGNNSILTSSTAKENYDRSESDNGDGAAAGTDANIGEEAGEEEAAGGQAKTDIYNREESQIEYGVSRKIETIEYGTGEIEKLSIGIFLNSEVTEEQIKDVESVIIAAAGIDTSRGDNITIKTIDFMSMDGAFTAEEETIEVPMMQKAAAIGGKIWPGALILAMLMMLSFRLKGKGGTGKAKVLSQRRLGGRGAKAAAGGADDGEDKYDKMADMLGGETSLKNFFAARDSNMSVEEKRKKLGEVRAKVLDRNNKNIYPELKELVNIEAQDNPDIALRVIENWLAEKV